MAVQDLTGSSPGPARAYISVLAAIHGRPVEPGTRKLPFLSYNVTFTFQGAFLSCLPQGEGEAKALEYEARELPPYNFHPLRIVFLRQQQSLAHTHTATGNMSRA